MKCAHCESQLHRAEGLQGLEMSTMVGYLSPAGHDHDDNCRTRMYVCDNGHVTQLSVQNKCTNQECNWRGKLKCFCHRGQKLTAWPEDATT